MPIYGKNDQQVLPAPLVLPEIGNIWIQIEISKKHLDHEVPTGTEKTSRCVRLKGEFSDLFDPMIFCHN